MRDLQLVEPRSLEFHHAVDKVIKMRAEKAHGLEKNLHATKQTARKGTKHALDCARVLELFRRRSHLCSMRTYDALDAVKTEKDFTLFLKQLLFFEVLKDAL
jgi:hypothetical protein